MRPSSRSRSLCTILIALAAGWTGSGCGGSEPAAEPAAPPSSPPAETASTEATGMAAEPIVYSDASVSYVAFRKAALSDLYAELSELTGDRLQLRVIPYVGRDDAGESVLKGETLYIFAQQPDADLAALKARADRLIAAVQEAFPDPGEDDKVEVHARLPDGSTVADLNPDLAEACGDNNLVRTGVRLTEYQPGSTDELFQFLCDGATVVDPFFVEEGWDHLPGAWRTTDEAAD